MSETKKNLETIQVVSFKLEHSTGKKEDYAIPIEQVKEIRTLEDITQVPNAKSHVKGVMNLRGLIVPVIDVKTKLGFDVNNEIDKDKQRIIVVQINDSLYGLLVDGVDQVRTFSTEDVDPVPAGTVESNKQIKGIVKNEGKLIALLDASPLISNPEKEISNVTSKVSQPTQESKTDEELPEELRELLDEKEIPQSIPVAK